MRHFIDRGRASNLSAVLSEVPPGQHVSLHSKSLDTPGTNNRQNKGSNDMVSLEAQLCIRIDKKDIRIADNVSSRDLFQMKASLLEREADFRRLQSDRVDARTIKL